MMVMLSFLRITSLVIHDRPCGYAGAIELLVIYHLLGDAPSFRTPRAGERDF
jgi:hypothetical protein